MTEIKFLFYLSSGFAVCAIYRAKDAGFLWEGVGKVMGSSWSSGGVVRSGEEAVAGLVGENGMNSAGLNVGEDRITP
nr:hypothetical protein [Tanacetum cinerariifolium]